MAFLLYKRLGQMLTPTGEQYRLAGYNLIYNLWVSRNKPTDQGWHISADDLIREYTGGEGDINTHSLLIDFHPNSTNRIGIIELLDIFAYTYSSDNSDEAGWTPMMLRLRDVLYEEFDDAISMEDKEKQLKAILNPTVESDFVEFLYLNGNNYGWNWGRNGMTNAAFLQGAARDYFRKYF